MHVGIFILCETLLPDLLMVLNTFMIHCLGFYWTSTMTIWKRCVFFFPYVPERIPVSRGIAWMTSVKVLLGGGDRMEPSDLTNAVDGLHEREMERLYRKT